MAGYLFYHRVKTRCQDSCHPDGVGATFLLPPSTSLHTIHQYPLDIPRVRIPDGNRYFPLDFFVGLLPDKIQVIPVEVLPDKHQLHGSRVDPFRIIPHDICPFHLSHSLDDPFDQIIQAKEFGNHRFDFVEERVAFVGFIEFGLALFFGNEQPGLCEAVQLHPHGVGGLVKFLGERAQVS